MSEKKGRICRYVLSFIRKSQIAIEHCYRFRDQNPSCHVLWVYVSSVQRFEQAYAEISRRLELPGCEDPKVNKLEKVSDWLNDESHEPWLLLLDNADDEGVFFNAQDIEVSQHVPTTPLIRYIPQSSNGSVLITSRNRNAAFRLTNDAETIVDVPLMDKENSKLILSRKLPQDQSTDGEILELVKMLDYLLLAIAQAAAFISMRKPRMTIARYMEYLRKNEKILLEDMGDLRRDPDMPNSVIKTWHTSFNQLRKDHPQSARLFSVMSVLDRQGLPDYLFSKGETDLDFEDHVARLIEFSLLNSSVDGHVFGIHRLVQIAMKCWLDLHGGIQKWKDMALDLLHRCFPSVQGPDEWRRCEALLPHAEYVLGYQYDQASQCLMQADVRHSTASYFYSMGKDRLAIERYQQTLDMRRRFLDGEHPIILHNVALLAKALITAGKNERVVELLEWVLSRRLKGEQALSHWLYTLSLLSTALASLGRLDEAEKICRRELRTSQELLGKEHISTQSAAIKLAHMLLDQEKGAEADMVLSQVVHLHQTSDASRSQTKDELICLKTLADIFRRQGKYQEAEQMSLSALEGIESLLGANHSVTLECASAYASVLISVSKLDQAEKVVLSALNANEVLRGSTHPGTLCDLFLLSRVQAVRGEFELAEGTCLKALKGFEKTLGVEHPSTMTCKEHLAITFWAQMRHHEAISLLTDVLRGYEKTLREGHPRTVSAKNIIDLWQREAGMLQHPSGLEGEISEASTEKRR